MRLDSTFAAAALALLLAACSDSPTGPDEPAHPDHPLFLEAARTAWSYADRQYQPATGLVNSVEGYPYATVWDIASGLSALYCAERLGLLETAEYDRRMRLALGTLQSARLFDGVTFNKNYSTATAAPAGRSDRDTAGAGRGYGWSAVDLGRLLVWLRIIAENQPRHAADARRVAERTDFAQVVRGGYLWGAELDAGGAPRRYSEGRLGYEQYAAAGFGLWGQEVGPALALHQNTFPIEVLGVPLLADRRGGDPLTSEPFVLLGLEVGWSAEMADFAGRLLRVQEERHRRTGQVTIVSEDALPIPPHYFYYYAVNFHGRQFAAVVPEAGAVLDWPRWVSAKAAFGWHALRPGDYTRLAVGAVAAAADPVKGWGSGVYEGTGAPTGGHNLNTAAVILEAAVHSLTGRPLLEGG